MTSAFLQYVLEEVLREVSGITSRAMFGGHALYKNGKIFGMVAKDVLYFKVGDHNRADYEKLGSKPFVFSSKGRTFAMSYWEVPEEIMSNPEEVLMWVNKSLEFKK